MLKRLLSLVLFPLLVFAQAPTVQVTTRGSLTVPMTVSQVDKNFTDLQHAANGAMQAWGHKETADSGLNFGYYGGQAWTGLAYAAVSDGTVALTASSTNYVQRTVAGVVSANTTGWTAGLLPMYQVITTGSVITAVVDARQALAGGDAANAPDRLWSAQAATSRVMSKLVRGQEDAFITFLSDSTGYDYSPSTPLRWIRYLTNALAPKYPAYTVKYRTWDSVGLAWTSWTTIQTGTGSQTLWINNGSAVGMPTAYHQGANFNPMVRDTTPDLVVISHGHNQQGNAQVNPWGMTGDFLALTESVSMACPYAGILMIGQNPETDSTNLLLMGQKNTAVQWVASSKGYGYINIFQVFIDYGPTWTTDLMLDTKHPNDAGETLWSNEVLKAFVYHRENPTAPNVISAFQKTAPQLVSNGTFQSWNTSLTAPANWTPAGTAVVTQDATNYESSNGYAMKISTTSGSGWVAQNIPLSKAAGRWITVAARVYVPATSNTQCGRVGIADGVTTQPLSGNTLETTNNYFQNGAVNIGQGAYRWVVVSRYIDPSAAYCQIKLYGDTSTSSGYASFDRVSVTEGMHPHDNINLDTRFDAPGTIGGTVAGVVNATTLNATGSTSTFGATAGGQMQVNFNAAINTARSIQFQTAGVNHWIMQADASTQSGSNAGDAFYLIARDDSGAGIDNPISIVRASGGAMTLTRPVSFTNGTATLGGNAISTPTLKVNGAAATIRGIQAQTAGVNRWLINLADASSESGSDAGSAFTLNARTDAGASIDIPFSITRAAGGNITLTRPLVGLTAATNTNSTVMASTAYVDRFAIGSATPSNPAGTTSTAGVMMGLAGAITPAKSGKVLFIVSGQMANSTVNDGVTVTLRYGTGSAPTNAAAITGTVIGASQTHTSLGAADTTGFSIAFPVTTLTVGTAVWYDISLAAVTGGTATATGISMAAVEQ